MRRNGSRETRSGGVRVEGDLFDISARLREIDDGYFILRRAGRFEVHNQKDRETFCLALPFDRLDARTVELVRRTRAERARELFEEMDRDNERLRREACRRAAEEAAARAEMRLAGERAERSEEGR